MKQVFKRFLLFLIAACCNASGFAQTCSGDRQILMDLYNATNGANWINRTNWGSAMPLSTWYGIQTNADGCVTGIDLDGVSNFLEVGSWNTGNGLVGQIPTNLNQLTELQYLSLAHNTLSGTIPTTLGDISNLTHLCLAENQLTGTIPTSLGNLSYLETLILSQNQLGDNTANGGIPTQMGNCPNLKYLYLGNNQLTGSIPKELGNLHHLIVMYLAQNQLTGAIPSTAPWTGNCFPALTEFWAQNNLLNQALPTDIGVPFAHLHYFLLYNNQIPSQIPQSLANLTEIKYFSLAKNLLTGNIPPIWNGMNRVLEIGLNNNNLSLASSNALTMFNGLNHLTKLILQNNLLIGEIPNFNLPVLQLLTLSHNQLTGEIPNFTGMPLLQQLYLSWNQLTNGIPNFTNFPVLQKLALHQNQLTSVPNFNLPALQELYLHNNQLSGSIPNFNSTDLPQLAVLWLQNNQLSGCLPVGLQTLCSPVTSGDISNNPALFTQSWAAFCNNGTGICAPLAVELTKFEAHPLDKNVELVWQTVSEKNNDHFDIERSTDGKGFSKIGEQKGHGTTSQVQNYVYLDTRPFAGVNYYRLKQIDKDGQFTYSKTVSVKMENSGKNIRVFPNPISNDLTIKVSDTEGVSSQLELYNLQGQLLKQQPLEAGLDETKVSMQELPAGVYMISLRQNGQIISSVKVTKH